MKKNAWMLAACLVAAGLAGSIALPAQAQVSIGVQIGPTYAPPPPRYEAVPVLPPGYVWTPGYWQWRNGRYVWRSGYRVHARPGYYWREPRWEQGPRGWVLREGGWDRDDDGHGRGHGRYHCPPGHARKGEC